MQIVSIEETPNHKTMKINLSEKKEKIINLIHLLLHKKDNLIS